MESAHWQREVDLMVAVADRVAQNGIKVPPAVSEGIAPYPKGWLDYYMMTMSRGKGVVAVRFALDAEVQQLSVVPPSVIGLLGVLWESGKVVEADGDEQAWLASLGTPRHPVLEAYVPGRSMAHKSVQVLREFLAPVGGLEDWVRWAEGL